MLKINGHEVVNCDSVSLAIIAKFGSLDGRLDLLDGLYGEIRTVEAWVERADLPA